MGCSHDILQSFFPDFVFVLSRLGLVEIGFTQHYAFTAARKTVTFCTCFLFWCKVKLLYILKLMNIFFGEVPMISSRAVGTGL